MATTAAMDSCAVLVRTAGGAGANDNEGGGGGAATMVVTATAGLDGVVAEEDAVIATTVPFGTEAGAV